VVDCRPSVIVSLTILLSTNKNFDENVSHPCFSPIDLKHFGVKLLLAMNFQSLDSLEKLSPIAISDAFFGIDGKVRERWKKLMESHYSI
jgi:hypothetical protein